MIVVAVASVWMVLAALASYRSENLAMSMVMALVSALLVGGCVGYLWLEERFPLHVRRLLEMKGHQINVLPAWSRIVGGAQGIQFDSTEGTFQGGADPRRDGYALGY